MSKWIDWVMKQIEGNKLDQVYLKLSENSDEIVDRCTEITSNATNEIYLMVDNPLPHFVTHKENRIINTLNSKLYEAPVKILIRQNDNENKNLRFFHDSFNIQYLSEKQLDIENLGERAGTLQHDYFLIGDKNIFWGKPGFNEGVFTYEAPHLTELVKKELDNLII